MFRWKLSGLPHSTQMTERDGTGRRPWLDWLLEAATRLNASPFRVQTVALTAQGAAITTTAIPTPVLPQGLYRATYSLRVTRAASSSSSATVTLGWTDGGVACSQAFAAVTGNTTATVQTGTFLVRSDADEDITYAVAYASVGATTMQFSLDVVLEAVPGEAT
jgi:hypothetical protein